jgi:hypothetical protein
MYSFGQLEQSDCGLETASNRMCICVCVCVGIRASLFPLV